MWVKSGLGLSKVGKLCDLLKECQLKVEDSGCHCADMWQIDKDYHADCAEKDNADKGKNQQIGD